MHVSLRPGLSRVGRLLGASAPDFRGLPAETEELAPAETAEVPPARFLEGQMDRIQGTAFLSPRWREKLTGGFQTTHGATLAQRYRNVTLIDGALYSQGATHFLRRAFSRVPWALVRDEVETACLYVSPGGSTYFGTWLREDTLTYLLTAGRPGGAVSPERPVMPHEQHYRRLLGMEVREFRTAFFRELVLFRDAGQNSGKRARFAATRARLTAGHPGADHPGVFLLRGGTGQSRVLENEAALAEQMSHRLGLRVVDPQKHSVEEIVAACAGSQMVMGVEGSHLAHGLECLVDGGTLFVLQPPFRFAPVLKDQTDRQNQRYAFVVGQPSPGGFTVNPEEVLRTLDLVPV
jgi:hypothetical protein